MPMNHSERDRSAVPEYLKMLRLDGRVFAVLGGGNGIGRQTAHALSQAGANVVCVDKDAGLANAVAAETGGVAVVADIIERAGMESVFSKARSRAGPVSGLVDIVGMPHLGPFMELDDAKWSSQFDLVLTHAFLALQVGGKAIAEAGGGSMVFVGSMAGITDIPGQAAYGAAKAALHHLVSGTAKELGPRHIRVNAVAPGFVRTPRLNTMLSEEHWQRVGEMTALGKAASPSEIASVILFLASDLASHVTGQVLIADAGIAGTVRPPKIWKT